MKFDPRTILVCAALALLPATLAAAADASPKTGSLQAAAEDDASLMKTGVDLLYAKNNPAEAAAAFRKVLEHEPAHYGATYQLATALERSGRKKESSQAWEKTLELAEKYNDENSAEAARSRLPGYPVVIVETSLGNFKMRVNAKRAPATAENFLRLVDEKFYDGTIFHRIMPGFMIQGGGRGPDGAEKKIPHPPLKFEVTGIHNRRGAVAMARTNDPDSANAQFFVNTVDNLWLDHAEGRPGYAAFGAVIEGMDVVDKIKAVQVNAGAYPIQPPIIKSIRRDRP